jgi:hypothetical protein
VIKSIREVTRDELPEAVLERAPNATGGVEVTREYLENERANAVFEAVAKGASDEMSYGYDPLVFDFSTVGEETIRNIREVRLWEISDVLFGANPATDGVKLFMPPEMLLMHVNAYLKAHKAGQRHSSRDIELINQIAQATIDLGATNIQLVEADDPDDEDEEGDEPKASDPPAPPERRAEPVSLTLEKARLFLLDYV